ncbi:MAG TPA: Clp protease N-terminal domain-containing protein [Streptosporangiaceae bacterium]|nr:Clp protease N-terminal domain-containing protein [Streptosporangiaceae bacterium]
MAFDVPVQLACGGEAAMVPLLGLTRYTEPAQHVLVLAEQQALADGDPAISTGDMLLGLLRADRAVAASALEALGITAAEVRRQLGEITRPDEDGASSYGISRRITFTRMAMGLLSHTIMALTKTGHAQEGQPRTPQGPYLCTGEMLVAMIGVLPESVVHAVPVDGPEAVQVLKRLGVDRSTALGLVIEQVRRSPADERWPGA